MKKLILIGGALACGKSTFSKILSQKFNLICLNKDNIKEILGDTIGFKDRQENLKLSGATLELMAHFSERVFQTGNDLLLESNFRDYDLIKINELATKYGYDILFIFCFADSKILYERFKKRFPTRNPVHKSLDFNDYEGFVEFIQKSKPTIKIKNTIEVDCNDFSFLQNEDLLNHINDFLKK